MRRPHLLSAGRVPLMALFMLGGSDPVAHSGDDFAFDCDKLKDQGLHEFTQIDLHKD